LFFQKYCMYTTIKWLIKAILKLPLQIDDGFLLEESIWRTLSAHLMTILINMLPVNDDVVAWKIQQLLSHNRSIGVALKPSFPSIINNNPAELKERIPENQREMESDARITVETIRPIQFPISLVQSVAVFTSKDLQADPEKRYLKAQFPLALFFFCRYYRCYVLCLP